jgi:hypothetical protein
MIKNSGWFNEENEENEENYKDMIPEFEDTEELNEKEIQGLEKEFQESYEDSPVLVKENFVLIKNIGRDGFKLDVEAFSDIIENINIEFLEMDMIEKENEIINIYKIPTIHFVSACEQANINIPYLLKTIERIYKRVKNLIIEYRVKKVDTKNSAYN